MNLLERKFEEKVGLREIKEDPSGIISTLVDGFDIDKDVAEKYAWKILKAKDKPQVKSILSDIMNQKTLEKAYKMILDELPSQIFQEKVSLREDNNSGCLNLLERRFNTLESSGSRLEERSEWTTPTYEKMWEACEFLIPLVEKHGAHLEIQRGIQRDLLENLGYLQGQLEEWGQYKSLV